MLRPTVKKRCQADRQHGDAGPRPFVRARFIGQNGRDEQDAHGKDDALDARDAHKPPRDIGIHLEKELDQVLDADYGGD